MSRCSADTQTQRRVFPPAFVFVFLRLSVISKKFQRDFHSCGAPSLSLSPSHLRHCLVFFLPLQRNTCRLEFTNRIPLPLTHFLETLHILFLNPSFSSCNYSSGLFICWNLFSRLSIWQQLLERGEKKIAAACWRLLQHLVVNDVTSPRWPPLHRFISVQ